MLQNLDGGGGDNLPSGRAAAKGGLSKVVGMVRPVYLSVIDAVGAQSSEHGVIPGSPRGSSTLPGNQAFHLKRCFMWRSGASSIIRILGVALTTGPYPTNIQIVPCSADLSPSQTE